MGNAFTASQKNSFVQAFVERGRNIVRFGTQDGKTSEIEHPVLPILHIPRRPKTLISAGHRITPHVLDQGNLLRLGHHFRERLIDMNAEPSQNLPHDVSRLQMIEKRILHIIQWRESPDEKEDLSPCHRISQSH
jgi:hypothetical protein